MQGQSARSHRMIGSDRQRGEARVPYLRGEVGTRVTCLVVAGAKRVRLGVAVTSVDPDSYRTSYVVRRSTAD